MSGDTFGCQDWGRGAGGGQLLLASWVDYGQDSTEHPTMHRPAPQQRLIQSETSIVPLVRNPGLDCKHVMS